MRWKECEKENGVDVYKRQVGIRQRIGLPPFAAGSPGSAVPGDAGGKDLSLIHI